MVNQATSESVWLDLLIFQLSRSGKVTKSAGFTNNTNRFLSTSMEEFDKKVSF